MTTALRETLVVLNGMQAKGVIGQYAICGAIAAFRYIEPASTEDIDVSVYLPGEMKPIIDLGPILRHLQEHGSSVDWRKEGIMIGAWPVQFLVAEDPLDRAATDAAESILFDDVPTRVWRIEHLMGKCLQVGRPKDHLRLEQFLDRAFDRKSFCDIIAQFGLRLHWLSYCRRFDRKEFCDSDA